MVAEYGLKIRELLATMYSLTKIIDFTHYSVFHGVSIYTAIIIGERAIAKNEIKCSVFKSEEAIKFMNGEGLSDDIKHLDIEHFTIRRDSLQDNIWILKGEDEIKILNKIQDQKVKRLNEIALIGSPLKTGRDAVLYHKLLKENSMFYYILYEGKQVKLEKGVWKKILRPRLLNKWTPDEPNTVVFFPYKVSNSKFELIEEKKFKGAFFRSYDFISHFQEILLNRRDSRKTWRDLGRGLKSKAPVKRGGYISLDVGLVSEILVPIDDQLSDDLSKLSKDILKNPVSSSKIEKEINRRIYSFFKITKEEEALIVKSLNKRSGEK
jgi:hypothetical protein